eukprot:CAMPEP_0204577270 /NCGR_PEP_ID=MMETSP0661-20131031/42249_1 /ASSEMBLY_ACC=CAM_ASM_000606 /TAXON_ID=109239 /ORGANISM="Alexandrium margalefi, Strain AMGDE01CS-322" /LENGTH=210 /DNA_ID=CAMNT_0051586085 /DNA_START=88 /DNA_END=718 /DNA_ORIENTATION=-
MAASLLRALLPLLVAGAGAGVLPQACHDRRSCSRAVGMPRLSEEDREPMVVIKGIEATPGQARHSLLQALRTPKVSSGLEEEEDPMQIVLKGQGVEKARASMLQAGTGPTVLVGVTEGPGPLVDPDAHGHRRPVLLQVHKSPATLSGIVEEEEEEEPLPFEGRWKSGPSKRMSRDIAEAMLAKLVEEPQPFRGEGGRMVRSAHKTLLGPN